MYQFIQKQADLFPVNLLCDVVGVSRSAYYSYVAGQSYQPTEKKEDKAARIIATFQEHKRRYGTRRLVKAFQKEGHSLSRHLASKVLAVNGLKAIQPRSFVPRTTNSRHTLGFNSNLLLRQGLPTQRDQVWVSDITYIMLANGQWAYLATWMDLWSRLIVGWHLDDNMEEDLVVTAFRRAALGRQPATGLIVHSDRGGQYASKEFRKLLAKYNCRQSMTGLAYQPGR